MRFQLLQILPHVWHELHIRHSCKRFAKVWWENGFQNKIVQFVCCSFCVSVLNWFKIHLKAVVFLHAFEESVDCHLLSSFCDDSNLHISLFAMIQTCTYLYSSWKVHTWISLKSYQNANNVHIFESNSFLISCFSNIYTLFPGLLLNLGCATCSEAFYFSQKNINYFLRLNLDFCEFVWMRFHCANGQVVLRSCATEREHCSPLLLR